MSDTKKNGRAIKEDEKPETLKEHSDRCYKYYKKMSNIKGIDKQVREIIDSLTKHPRIQKSERELIYEMFISAMYLHDIGKINPKFQTDKMNNINISSVNNGCSEHSIISALIYIDIFTQKVKESKNRKLLDVFLYSFAYEISRHHTYLQDFSERDFLSALEGVKNKIYYGQYQFKDRIMDIELRVSMDRNIKLYNIRPIEFYILNKLLYSIIVSCDYYATYEYMNGQEIELDIIEDIDDVISKYRSTDIYKNIEEYKNGKAIYEKESINELRTSIFLEAEKNLLDNLDKNIYYLEAPTGSGKTNTSINLAIDILEKKREFKNVFYIFPFNTITEQTAENFSKFLENEKDFMCINSVTPIVSEKEKKLEENLDYNKIYLDYQFMHYPIIITSHVNLFSALFGTGREANLILSRFCNSVIIIDEIQSYKNKIWREIITFFQKYAKSLNIKIIIMSATLPKLDSLLSEDELDFESLIKDKFVYYKNPLFKNRVSINTELLDIGKITLENLYEEVYKYKNKKVLIEFIKKKTARDFYNLLKKKIKNVDIIEITGDDNKHYRKEAIERIKTLDNIIVVATQTIEAGVDIDTDIGFKDISLIESEEQFIGRVNRSAKKKDCSVYFFDMDNANDVYRNDARIGFDIRNEELKQDFINKDFDKYYEKLLNKLKKNSESYNQNNIKILYDEAGVLRYKEIEKRMQLIDSKTLQIFFNYTIITDKEKIVGKKIWEEYKEFCFNQDMSYSEKQIKLSQLNQKMSYFIYSINVYEKDSVSIYSDDEFGNMHYVENGDEYIVNRKI